MSNIERIWASVFGTYPKPDSKEQHFCNQMYLMLGQIAPTCKKCGLSLGNITITGDIGGVSHEKCPVLAAASPSQGNKDTNGDNV